MGLASSAARDGCYEEEVVRRSQWQPNPLTRNSSTLRKQIMFIQVPVSEFFGGICFELTNTKINCAVTHLLFNYYSLIDFMEQSPS
jgi:hypothetical protein